MVTKRNIHSHIFLHAFRTAVIFVAGFIIYEVLVELEKEWNKNNLVNAHTILLKEKV